MRDNCLELLGPRSVPRDRHRRRRRATTTPICSPTCRAWLDEHWDPDLTVARVVGARRRRGMDRPALPARVGRARLLAAARSSRSRAAFQRHGAVQPPGGLGLLMAAPTILSHGTEEQIERLVPPIYDGSVAWCQLFSEPGVGLRPRRPHDPRDARRRPLGDLGPEGLELRWPWSADYGMLLARTDFDVPKHAGISWFAFPLDQPGVTIRPLREITGHALFNEVFFDDAVVADADLIGGVNNGWAVTHTTLMFERVGHRRRRHHERLPAARARRAGSSSSGPATPRSAGRPTSTSKVLDRRRAVRAGAPRTGATDDPLVRQKLARLVEYARTGEWTAKRSVAETARGGGAGPRQRRQARADPHRQALGRDRAATSSGPTACSGTPTARARALRRGPRVRGRVVDLRRHRPDPAQRHRRARARAAEGAGPEQGSPVPRSPGARARRRQR